VKAPRFLAAALLMTGGALTCRAGYQQAKAALAERLIRRAWNSEIGTGKTEAPWPQADLRPAARLQIPRLSYDQIVLEGATPRTLAFGPARMLNGARFGEHGNLLLAGHRDSWFLPLQSITAGDEIRLAWYDARSESLSERRYTVSFVRVVEPTELTLLAPTTEDALTLLTCYPFGHQRTSPQRFIVRAAPTLQTEAAKSPEKALRLSAHL
jgi:sortase A